MTIWIVIYIAGAILTAWYSSHFGWMPGTSNAWKVVVGTGMIVLWPLSFVLFLLSAIGQIGMPRH
jgi:hypothetical protein